MSEGNLEIRIKSRAPSMALMMAAILRGVRGGPVVAAGPCRGATFGTNIATVAVFSAGFCGGIK